MSKSNNSDILIIGGGIIGLLTARELVQAGATVTLIDKNQTGKESSWAGGGILSPLYPWRYPESVNALANWSKNYYPALAQSLTTSTGVDPQWIQNGLLILDNLSPEEQKTANDWIKANNCNIERLVNSDLQNTEKNLNPNFNQALQLPDIAQIRNPRLVKALKIELRATGVNIIENTEVTDLLTQHKQIVKIKTQSNNSDTNHTHYSAQKIVVASGAWSASLLEKMNINIDVKPVRGQMILIKAKPGLISNIILHKDQYLIPRHDGRVLVGSTLENVGFDKSTTETARNLLWKTACKLVPALSPFPIEHHWAGLRPGTQQGIPIITQHPEIENLFINTGHFRNGVILGPASARLLTEIMMENCTTIDPKPYSL